MPGPPPKPNEQKRRLGNPGQHKLPDVATVTALPALPADDVPESLSETGAALWQSVTATGRAWLAPSDHPVLMLLCELADRRVELSAHIADHGWTVTRPGDGHMVANPAVAMLADVEKRMVHIASLLGMTPADRTRMGLAEVKAANAFEQMLSRKSDKREH